MSADQDFPTPILTAEPQSSVFTGDSVTLRCELIQSHNGWEFLWTKHSHSESTETATTIINSVKVSDGGEYKCRARRGRYYTERPKPKVTIKPAQHVFRGDTVTLRCDINGKGVTSWSYSWYKEGSTSVFSDRQEHTLSFVTESDAGKYTCYGSETEGSRWSQKSDKVTLTVLERPKPKVTIKPDQHVFRGDTVTLRCDLNGEGVTNWSYSWYKEGLTSVFSDRQEHTLSSVTKSNAGKYTCKGSETGGSRWSQMSDAVTLTVSDPRAVLSVSPHMWLTEGDPVTLICEVYNFSTGWTFSWFTLTVSAENSRHYNPLSDSSRGAGGNYTVSSAALNHTGVYSCRAEREKPAYKTQFSNTQLLWVTGVSPPVSLIVSPSRTQHFTSVSLSLICEDQSNSTGWRVRRYTDGGRLEDCSSLHRGSQTGSTCTISSTITSHTGVYWCESESGEKHHPVNITVHSGVILESPVHPVTEGDHLILHCLYQHTTSPNLRADFYKDGSLIQNQTTEMSITTVSKSHEGFYYCKHPERGESPKSWISVRASTDSRSDGLKPITTGVTAGLTVSVLIIVFLILLWRYRKNKGGRSQSPSTVSQQQNNSQTSDQNQSGTAHIYDSGGAAVNKDISTDSVSESTELTYAEIELKSTKKKKKKKENKGAGSSDVTHAQSQTHSNRAQEFTSLHIAFWVVTAMF
ncbi:Fc receptor-like protein 5 [Labeo rohita]|uniref:Fc receptor-like protein 5 n=1 Tax=Labeo rohita TaxID=84645 RepID=A0ABQ8L9M3_LABRO|nr:Fc receptor-like protein 5 [Labeo rohita]